MTVLTIGHSTRKLEDFLALLQGAEVDHLADVRRFPHSPRQPHFNIESLPASLAGIGIGYTHMEALGGRRKAHKDSPHTLWREEGFRGYADYAETPPFRLALNDLLRRAQEKRVAIMCAEALWWQCHRRIIADYLLAAGIEVNHILDGKIEPARLTTGAIIKSGSLLYSDMPLLSR
jgi:uncharacterized protein (DUF488 family)